MLRKTISLLIFCSLVASVLYADTSKQDTVVTKARLTFEEFISDADYIWIKDNLKDAVGVIIYPQILKAGFILGAEGGTGVLLRQTKNHSWSEPAFYTLSAGSVGFQIGAQSAQAILVIRTPKALETFYTDKVTLGGNVSFAAGPVGAGASSTVTAQIVSFSKAKGAFAGVSLDGMVITTKDSWNNAYYGKEVRPVDILVKGEVKNPQSEELQTALHKACR